MKIRWGKISKRKKNLEKVIQHLHLEIKFFILIIYNFKMVMMKEKQDLE